MNDLFNTLGCIIYEYLPEHAQDLYELKLLKPLHIVDIENCLYSKKYWNKEFYGQLKWLKRIYFRYRIFIDDLGPLQNSPIEDICMQGFVGSLEPLRNCRLIKLWMDLFDGDLEPLQGHPLQDICMWDFTGNLEPLRGAPIHTICMYSFEGDLEPLKD